MKVGGGEEGSAIESRGDVDMDQGIVAQNPNHNSRVSLSHGNPTPDQKKREPVILEGPSVDRRYETAFSPTLVSR